MLEALTNMMLLNSEQYSRDRQKAVEIIERRHPNGTCKLFEFVDVSRVTADNPDAEVPFQMADWFVEWEAYLRGKYRDRPHIVLATQYRFMLDSLDPALREEIVANLPIQSPS